MANFSALKTAIQNAIKQNGNEEITGDVLQQILLSIVSTMGDGAINTIEQNLSNETLARGNADTQLQNAINAIKANIDNGYVYGGIATPSSTPVSGKVFYIATAAGTYTNFGGQVLTQGINILRYNGSAWSIQQLIGIDDVPTVASNSLVKSGGVQNELALGAVYDVSAKNPTAGPNNDGKFTLEYILDQNNVNTLIPAAYRKGGMSIKFVQSSDNNYTQFRCKTQAFSANPEDWYFEGDDTLVENPEYIKVITDGADHLLGWIRKEDGGIDWAVGVPKPVKDYVAAEIAKILNGSVSTDIDGINKIIAFLDDFSTSDTLAELLATKVDKEEDKSLIPTQYIQEVENPEYIHALIDNNDKITEATKKDGGKLFSGDVEVRGGMSAKEVSAENILLNGKALSPASTVDVNLIIEDPEGRLKIETDEEDKIISYRKPDGTLVECVGIEAPNLGDYVNKEEGKGLINSEYAESVDVIEDPEERLQIGKDSENRIYNYRKKDGTLVENVGIETNHLELTEQGMSEFQQALKDAGFNPSVTKIKDYNLPKFGHTNIVSETFYLTADSRYSDKSGIYLIRDYPDTDENAMNHVTLDYFYIKSTLHQIGEDTYEKYNDGIEGHDVKLTFYPAGLVTKVSSQYYVTSTLDENGQPIEGESIEVTQIIDTVHINAWPVNKKNEHYCTVTVDFGHYLTGTFKMGVKFQGSSTLNFRKKNLRFTFYKNNAKPYYPYDDDKFGKKDKVKVGEMVRTSGYNLKANWNDNSRIKEDIMTILLMAVWDNRGSYKNYPWDDDATPFTSATGMIKGFPIDVSIGGNFYGLDIFGLKKDKANYLLDKDKDGMIQGGTRGNWRDTTNWTAASPGDWEDELNDEEDWDVMYPSGNGQTASNDAALKEFFEYINGRLYEDGSGVAYLNTQVTEVGRKFYVTSTLTPDQSSVTATRTSNPAYIGSDDNLYILSELTEFSGTLYVTSTLVDGQPTADSVTATLVEGGHNIYAGSDGNRYLSTSLTLIDGVYYVTSKIVWDTTSSTEVSNIPFDKKTMPERMGIPYWIDYIICMQVFLMRDNTCRNLMLYSAADKKKFYPFFYDLDLSWNFNAGTYNLDIMVPADPSGQGGGVSYAGDMSLWENFKDAWWDEIINRYNELRGSVLTIPYITQVYKEVADNIPDEEYSKENNKWNKNTSKKIFEDLISYMEFRLDWLDNEYYK